MAALEALLRDALSGIIRPSFQLPTADQVKALVKSHAEGDENAFIPSHFRLPLRPPGKDMESSLKSFAMSSIGLKRPLHRTVLASGFDPFRWCNRAESWRGCSRPHIRRLV